MNEPLRFGVILPSGQKTKPYSKDKIAAAFESGKLPNNATVETPNGAIPIADFCAVQKETWWTTVKEKYGLPARFGLGGFLAGVGVWSFSLRDDAGSWMGIVSVVALCWATLLFMVMLSHTVLSKIFPDSMGKFNGWIRRQSEWDQMSKEQRERTARTMAIAAGKATYDEIRDVAKQVSE